MLSGTAKNFLRRPILRGAARWLVAGQPTHLTHPELLGEDELAPGIPASEFAERRRKLSAALPHRAVVLIPSASPVYYAAGIALPFRQDANFLYLTGIAQQGVVVIRNVGDNGENEFVMFVPDASEKDRWDGEKIDCEAATSMFGADRAYPLSKLETQLPLLTAGASNVYMDKKQGAVSVGLQARVTSVLGNPCGVLPIESHIHMLRATKSLAEVKLMHLSARIASRAIHRCMELTKPGISEAALAAHFEHSCKLMGAGRLAYPPIAASGADACTIHYLRNDKVVRKGDLILMDAGCEVFGYCSDVTRTWPASGLYSGAQKDLYDVVLAAHKSILNACKPGALIQDLHTLSIQLLSDGLAQLQIGSTSRDALMNGVYRQFYPHMIGHFLGMDVHDTKSISRSQELHPGAVLAVEPGCYIPNEHRFGHFRGIGIRVEDDVLVTEKGAAVLSSEAPTDSACIESLVQTGEPSMDISLLCRAG